jgi:large subunit ribosomal protein L4
LSAKQAAGKLIILDSAEGSGKTKDLVRQLEALGWGSVLVIDGPAPNVSFTQAASNIPKVDVLPTQGANVYDILRRDTLVLTRDAVEHLEARLK